MGGGPIAGGTAMATRFAMVESERQRYEAVRRQHHFLGLRPNYSVHSAASLAVGPKEHNVLQRMTCRWRDTGLYPL